MAILEIKVLGAEVLRTPAEPVESFDDELESLVADMFETMYHADGIGLAAPQIGVSKRLFVIDVRASDEEGPGPLALINPTIVEYGDDIERAPEGCLSIPGMEETVDRPTTVRIDAVSVTGEPISLEADGLFARALQHEFDHLDGVLFIDRISPLKRRLLLRKWRKSQED